MLGLSASFCCQPFSQVNTALENSERNHRSSGSPRSWPGHTAGQCDVRLSMATVGSEGPITQNSFVDTNIRVRKLERHRLGAGDHPGGRPKQVRAAETTLNQVHIFRPQLCDPETMSKQLPYPPLLLSSPCHEGLYTSGCQRWGIRITRRAGGTPMAGPYPQSS